MALKSEDVGPKAAALIVEPNPNGHRLTYVSLLVDRCISQGREVRVMTSPAAIGSAQWAVHLGEKSVQVITKPLDNFTLDGIARVAAQTDASLTIVPDGDGFLIPALRKGWEAPGTLSMLVMRADEQAKKPWLRHTQGIAKKMLVLAVGFRSNVRVCALRSPLVKRRGFIRWAADPVNLSATPERVREMRNRLEGYGKHYWIGVFGSITPRKNLPLIIQAILDQPDVGLVIGGSIDPDVSAAIAPLLDEFSAAGGRVLKLPGTLTEVEFDSAISAVDCIVVAHTNEGPSGIVLKAVAAGRRLILAGAKSLKRDAAHLREQAVWSELDAKALAQSICQAKISSDPIVAVHLENDNIVSALT